MGFRVSLFIFQVLWVSSFIPLSHAAVETLGPPVLLEESAGTSTFPSDEGSLERGESKNFNVLISPIFLLLTQYNLEAQVGISGPFAMSVYGKYFRISGFEMYHLGLRGDYYFNGNRLTSGPYIAPALSYIPVRTNFLDRVRFSPFAVSAFDRVPSGMDLFNFTVTAGYHWLWQNGFNLRLGLGLGFLTYLNVPLPALDAEVGFAF